MTLFKAISIGILAGILGSSPVWAQPMATRDHDDTKVLNGVIPLDFRKHQMVLQELGIQPSDAYYSCICAAAGYGSSSTSQFYHPETIGTYDARYSCQQPGDPCVVSGFGCSRHPLPTDPKIWESCSAQGDAHVVDQLLNQVRGKWATRQNDLKRRLAQCRRQNELNRNRNYMLRHHDGYEYLRRNGKTVLPPPERIENKLNRQAKIAGEEARATLSKAEQQTKAKIEDGLIDNIGVKLFQSAKGKEINVQAARLALTANASLVAENTLKIHRQTAKLNRLKRQTSGIATRKEKMEISDLKSSIKGIERDQQNLANEQRSINAFMLGLDGAQDLLELEKNYLRAISGDRKEQVTALISTTSTIKKYVDMAQKNRVDLKAGLSALAKTGISEAEFARFKTLSLQSDFLAAASGMLNGIASVGTTGVKAYDLYKKYEKISARAHEMERSGQYSKAQERMLAAAEVAAELAQIASGHMPEGFSQLTQVYAEALRIPGAMDKRIREYNDEADIMADIKGSQAQSKAMLALGNLSVDRNTYLFRTAKLPVYRVDKGTKGQEYVLIDSNSDKPLFLSQDQYKALQDIAYYHPLAHKDLLSTKTVTDLLKAAGPNGALDVKKYKDLAENELKTLARRKLVADRMGQKSATYKDTSQWSAFQQLLGRSLPPLCDLSPKTESVLFDRFRADDTSREQVSAHMADFGAELRTIDSNGN